MFDSMNFVIFFVVSLKFFVSRSLPHKEILLLIKFILYDVAQALVNTVAAVDYEF